MITADVAEVGQTWAANAPKARAANHNQNRRVLALTTKDFYMGFRQPTEQRPCAVLTCDGEGKRRSTVMLAPDGSIRGHRLVADPDPRIEHLAQAFGGVPHSKPFGGYHWEAHHASQGTLAADLIAEVREALLWPRTPDGAENRRIEVVLHQDALLAIAERLTALTALAEQSAMTMADRVVGADEAEHRFDEAVAKAEAALATLVDGRFPSDPVWDDGEGADDHADVE